LGNGCSLSNGCSLGDGCRLGNYCSLGNGCSLGNNSTNPVDIGYADGYRKCVACVEGVAYIGAGCRWFTLSDALHHWSGNPNRITTVALLHAAMQIAAQRGWKTN
jgi:hypothetical protein